MRKPIASIAATCLWLAGPLAAPGLAQPEQGLPPGGVPMPGPRPDGPRSGPETLRPDDLPEGHPPMVMPPPGGGDRPTNPDAFGGPPSPGGPPAPGGPAANAAPSDGPPADLETLFTELKREADGDAAKRIAARIQRRMTESGSATTDLLMERAGEALRAEDNGAALDFLDQALVLDPGYAEAWNRRATLNFMMGRLGKSIADIEQTLAREPRHWGALMGLAAILERTDRKEKALDVYMQALDVYPALDSAQEAAGRLSDEIGGSSL